ncbi:MAG: type II toxin-antitoxin system HicB family antitoxin [Tepidiformaceae bacterium]
MTDRRKPLSYYLGLQYTFNVIAEEEGGYFIIFPDLPGCMTQAETLDEVVYMAEDARQGWIETEYERGNEIPEPTYAYA